MSGKSKLFKQKVNQEKEAPKKTTKKTVASPKKTTKKSEENV